jgi:ferric-dicitrate binding protein FerR (iron transport regulator)
MRRNEAAIAKRLKRSLPSAQQEQEAGKRVFYRLLLARTESSVAALPNDDERSTDRKWRPRLVIAFASTAALASFFFIVFATNGLWRTGEVLAHTEPSGDPIRSGQVVQADSPEGLMLVLQDRSRVEMCSGSKLQMDRADDGLRLRLNTGTAIVTAAKQGAGHLYVETKDAMVSVIGTVFVVRAEETGSRVGVLEGLVDVRQGTITQKLRPGQQLSTHPAMEPVPLDVQVSCSRNVTSLLALLQRSVPPLPQPPPPPALAAAASVVAPPRTPAAVPQNAQVPDSLLILGGAGNGQARGGQRPATPETERALEQALVSREPIPDLPFQVETNYFQQNRAEYFVSVTLKIPGSQLAGSQSAKRIALDIMGRVVDDYGTSIVNLRDAVDVRLSDEAAKELPMRQIVYEAGFKLLPGRYTMKFLIHDVDTDRNGTYETSVVIPNLNKDAKNLPISSVVLSSELISFDDALPNSLQRSFSPDGQSPLVIEGKKLIPRLNGPFSKRRDLMVFLQAYEPNTTATEPLTAFVTFYRGDTKVFETPQLTFKDELSGRPWRTIPVQLRVPLASLPEGAYDCQVTVLNPATQKSAVWRSPIRVVN